MSEDTSGTHEPGIYVKGLEVRTATTRREAVALAFDGYSRQEAEKVDESDDDTDESTDAPAAVSPTAEAARPDAPAKPSDPTKDKK